MFFIPSGGKSIEGTSKNTFLRSNANMVAGFHTDIDTIEVVQTPAQRAAFLSNLSPKSPNFYIVT